MRSDTHPDVQISYFRNERDNQAKRRCIPWADWPDFDPDVVPPDVDGKKPLKALRAWSPAQYVNGKRSKHVERTVAIVIDVDKASKQQAAAFVEAVRESGYEAVIHSSYSHTAKRPKLRVIVPLDRGASSDEHRATWHAFLDAVNTADCPIDDTSSEPSRLYYLPAIPAPTSTYVCEYLPGAPFKVVEPLAGGSSGSTSSSTSIFSKNQYSALVETLTCHYGAAGTRNKWRVAAINWLLAEGGSDREIAGALNAARRAIDEPLTGRWEVSDEQVDRQRVLARTRTSPATGLPTLCRLASDPPAAATAWSLWSQGNRVILERAKSKKVGEDGPIKRTAVNLERVLTGDVLFTRSLQFDALAGELQWAREVRGVLGTAAHEQVRDTHYVALQIAIDTRYGVEWSTRQIGDAVAKIASENVVDSVRDYLSTCKWDGRPRIDNWLAKYCGAAPEIAALYGGRWLIGAVARALQPGAQVDSMLILAGRQGTGKSSALRILAGERAFTDSVNPAVQQSREAAERAGRFWICEISELAAFRRTDLAHLKAFLTQREDTYRAAYARNAITRQRRYVFAGSVNNDHDPQFLADDGIDQRRFWVVECGQDQFDLVGLQRDRDQLWAEALHRFRAGDKSWLATPDVASAHRDNVARYVAVNPIDDLVSVWAARRESSEPANPTQILCEIGEPRTPSNRLSITVALRRLGWINTPIGYVPAPKP